MQNMTRLFCSILLAGATLAATPVFNVTYNRGPNDDGRYVIGLSTVTLQRGTGSPVTFDAMCFDFQEEIYDGEHYHGETVKLTDYTSNKVLQTRYDIAGFAYLGMLDLAGVTYFGPGLSQGEVRQAIQYGVWDLMDPNEHDDGNIYGSFKYGQLIDGMVDGFIAHPTTLTLLDETLKTEFPHALDNLYVVQGVGDDRCIQKFIIGGNLPNGVPEPGSISLMGGGLLGLAAVIRRRAKR
jgi:hypothetical protein